MNTGCLFYFTRFQSLITWPLVNQFWRFWSQCMPNSLEFINKRTILQVIYYFSIWYDYDHYLPQPLDTNVSQSCQQHSLTGSSLLEIFQPFLNRFICWWSYFSTIFSCEESSNFRRALVLVHPEDTIGFDFFRKHFFRCRDHFSDVSQILLTTTK